LISDFTVPEGILKGIAFLNLPLKRPSEGLEGFEGPTVTSLSYFFFFLFYAERKREEFMKKTFEPFEAFAPTDITSLFTKLPLRPIIESPSKMHRKWERGMGERRRV